MEAPGFKGFPIQVIKLTSTDLACENSRPSSLPARVAFRVKGNATRAGSEEGRLFSQATTDLTSSAYFYFLSLAKTIIYN